MDVPHDLKVQLLRLKERIPPESRDVFARKISEGMESLQSERTVWGALIGGAIGAVIDAIPGTGFISDDWVTIGAGLGAWVGYAKDRKERERREEVRTLIQEALRDALA